MEPLAALNLGKTKSGVPRSIPVHSVLRAILDEFWTAGWERIYGSAPTEDDFIVPTRNFTIRESPNAQHPFIDDLKLLSLRARRGHDLRRTFITLAQVDGARRDILESISHGPRGDVVSVYTNVVKEDTPFKLLVIDVNYFCRPATTILAGAARGGWGILHDLRTLGLLERARERVANHPP